MRLVAVCAILMSTVSWADTTEGKALYDANCSACHGVDLDGNGPAGSALQPTPSNFSDPAFWVSRDSSAVKASIKNGKPGTAMMSFAHLPESETEAIVAYLIANKP